MRDKVYEVLNKVYGGILIVSFFAGVLPLIPFIVAIVIGGEMGESISIFLYKQYYPWVIAAAAISVVIGWIASYVKKKPAKKKDETKAQ